MSKKLPYIPDKKLYAAVMGACSWIRKDGYFNKAVNYYADKYDVDPDDVAKYVRIAQGNGQRQANAKQPKRKYHWFAIEYSMGTEHIGCNYFDKYSAEYTVLKGLRKENVEYRLSANDDWSDEHRPQHWFGRIEKFDTKEEACECAQKWKDENFQMLMEARNEWSG